MSFSITFDQGLATLSLTNPAKRNLLTPAVSMQIAAELTALYQEPDLKVLAVIGTERSFCAGADLAALAQASQGDGEVLTQIYQAFRAVAACPVLSVALVNGAATGAGMNLAMACDIRYASPEAWFESRFFQLAIHPGGGHTALLPKLVGWQQAAAMLLAGERMLATQALELGFVKAIFAQEELVTHAHQLARQLQTVPAALLRETKASMQQLAAAPDMVAAVDYEFERQFASLQQPEARARIAALQAQIKGE